MAVSADLTAFRTLAARLETLGPTVLQGAMKEAASNALDFVAEEFESGTDPYGAAWPKSARASKQSGQTLVDTARLRNSFTDEIGATGFTVTSNVKYARIHNNGGEIKKKPRLATLHFEGRRFAKKTSKKITRTLTTTIGDHVINMPQRMMVPTGGQLPQKWATSFESTIRKHAARHLLTV